MSLVLFLLGAIGFIMFKLYTTSKELRENVPMLVEMHNNLSDEQQLAIAEQLGKSDMVREVKKVSKDEILRRTLSAKLINFSPQNAEDVILKAFNTLIALQ